MAWTAPLTAVANAALTAAQWNASVRDNLLITTPALATTGGQHFVATGPNAVASRTSSAAALATSDTTASSTFGALSATSGPAVTVTSGPTALVLFGCRANNSSATQAARAGVAVSGASTYAADINYALNNASGTIMNLSFGFIWSAANLGALTSGSNTFTMQYRTDGTGTGTFSSRTLSVVPF
jgi:hypothetical protein